MSGIKVYVVSWSENHPDRDHGVLACFATEEAAEFYVASQEAKDKHSCSNRGYSNMTLNYYSVTELEVLGFEDVSP